MKQISVIIIVLSALGLSACANTIRGVGQDTANTVNATKSAGNEVAAAVE